MDSSNTSVHLREKNGWSGNNYNNVLVIYGKRSLAHTT